LTMGGSGRREAGFEHPPLPGRLSGAFRGAL
jgi:hypothetical protein